MFHFYVCVKTTNCLWVSYFFFLRSPTKTNHLSTYFMLSFLWPFKLFTVLHAVSIPTFFTLLPPLHLHHSFLQGGSNHALQEKLSSWIVAQVAIMMTKYAFCVNGVSQFCLLKLCFKLFVSSSAGLSSGCSSFYWRWILFQWR